MLAPIQAGSSLYNIVNRAAYGDLEFDTEAMFDFINIATLGLGKISTAGKFATKTVADHRHQQPHRDPPAELRPVHLISFDTFQELMQEGDPNEDPRELRQRKSSSSS